MRIYDLSKELFSSAVFPGDPAPAKTPFLTISETCPCNLTVLTLGSHNGTHMDAPKHFVAGAKDIAQVPLEKCVGPCTVARFDGVLTAADARRFMEGGVRRLLIRGEIEITVEAAQMFADAGLWFLGVEGMTVGGPETGAAVHRALLRRRSRCSNPPCFRTCPQGNISSRARRSKCRGWTARPAARC
ncbi:MAG: cyclase family protein [Acutalibacteraceae bacterium]